MKHVALSTVVISNFRSYQGISVVVSNGSGLKLFSGQNNVEPRLGANGCGKSSFWEAVVWCFFGSGVKGARTSDLVAWNTKTAEVLTEVTINNEVHTIYRSGPPMRLEVDDQPATQEEVDRLLGLTKEQFIHSVVFGQGVSLFPDLPIPKRGELLDGVLNLDVWLNGSKHATDKCTELEKELSEKKLALSRIEGRLVQLQPEKDLIALQTAWKETQAVKIAQTEEEEARWAENLENEIEEYKKKQATWQEEHTAECNSRIQELNNIEAEAALKESMIEEIKEVDLSHAKSDLKETESKALEIVKAYTKLQNKLESINEERTHWLQMDNNCPVCEQPIPESLKQFNLQKLDTEEQELTIQLNEQSTKSVACTEELNKKREAVQLLLTQATQQASLKRSYQEELKSLKRQAEQIARSLDKLTDKTLTDPYAKQIQSLENQKNPYKSRLASLRSETNPYDDLIVKNKQVRQILTQEKVTIDGEINQVASSITAVEYWKHGFKRIRLYFVNQILAALQIEIQSAISALGLDGWSVGLATESETKSGTTKLGVQIHINSPIAEGEWSVWSGGESQRLRLAIAMGLASLIQRASGVFYGWETWDEPSAWLSSEGIEDLLQALQYRADVLKKSIWVVDHRALQFAGFKEIWMVSKDVHGSSINLLSEAEV